MKEDFLHYVWKFQKFSAVNMATVEGEILHIINSGQHNQNSGPDFFSAQIELAGQRWAGYIEIHINASDWYAHGHETDPAYDNVILHAVWQYDAEVYRKDGTIVPTLVLKDYVEPQVCQRYQNMFLKEKVWITCESDLSKVDDFVIENWLESLYLERLQTKQEFFLKELEQNQNHWEALLFTMLCRNFGLMVNAESFFSVAKSVDFSVVKKCSQENVDLEALLMGQAGFFEADKEDWYFKTLKTRYEYLRLKFSLETNSIVPPKFFRLRPPNFPTVRLSQLAELYTKHHNLFAEIINTTSLEDFYTIFKVAASDYWDTHFNFGLSTIARRKGTTKNFIDLLLINTVIPIKFCYASQQGKDIAEEILALAGSIPCEENQIIKKFNSLKPIAKNAYQSQGLLQLKKEYCDKNKCLQCAIGNFLIKK